MRSLSGCSIFPTITGKTGDCITEIVGDPVYVEIHGFADFEKLSAWNANIFKESMEDLVNFGDGMYSHITIVKYVD